LHSPIKITTMAQRVPVAYPGFCERGAPLGGLGTEIPQRGPGSELLVGVWVCKLYCRYRQLYYMKILLAILVKQLEQIMHTCDVAEVVLTSSIVNT